MNFDSGWWAEFILKRSVPGWNAEQRVASSQKRVGEAKEGVSQKPGDRSCTEGAGQGHSSPLNYTIRFLALKSYCKKMNLNSSF